MAVKVVKKSRKKRVKCKSCKSTLEYEDKDVVTQDAREFYGCGDGWKKYIKCPSCEHQVILEEKPSSVRGLAESFRPGR